VEDQLENFDEWLANFEYVEPEYAAKYNTTTGTFISIGPASAFEGEPNVIPIKKELLIDIDDGKVKMHQCVVDPFTQKINIISKTRSAEKELILYQIPVVRFGGAEISEVYLTYNKLTKVLDIELSQIYKGTKRFFEQDQQRSLYIKPTTEINFFVCDKNDPHVIHKLIRFPIQEIVGNKKSIVIDNLPDKFSIYTKKVFKKYLLEIIDENSGI